MHYKKIGLFGGTFDPLHIGHLVIAEWIWDLLKLDKIFFIPNYIHPFQKREDITPADKRLRMLELAINRFPQFEIDAIELEREGISYTVDTVKYFSKKYPASELFLLIGADNLRQFHKWKAPQQISKMTKLVVYNRRDIEETTLQSGGDIIFTDSPFIDISSTQIRKRIHNGQAFRSLVPAQVYSFIKEQNLYR